MASVIDVKNLSKSYLLRDERLEILKNITFSVQKGEWISFTGPSGSGKTTLLSLLAGLEKPDSGELRLLGEDLTKLSEDRRARFRAEKMGFIFQSFRLMPHLTALENVQVPLEILGVSSEARAREALSKVGLQNRLDHQPSQLSGGEQQRVAVARAFVSRPELLFADEPTGNLDVKNAAGVFDLIEELRRENGTTLLLVTHDNELANRAQRMVRLRSGNMEWSR